MNYFSYFLAHLKRLDWSLIVLASFLTMAGLLEIYSISLSQSDFLNFEKQLLFFALGLSFIFILSFFDYRIIKANSYIVFLLYLLGVISLMGLLFFGSEIRGVQGWYKIGSFSFDPVPFIAILLIVILAKYFSRYHVEIYRFRHIALSAIYVVIPAALVFFQPDFGSAAILILIWVGMVIFSGVKLSHFLIILLIFSLTFLFSWNFLLEDYQKGRIISFLNPQVDQMGISWNVNQSQIAIGSGGLLGKGIGQGSQTQYGFLPEAQTDFIFSALAEETGLCGLSLLLLAFLFLIFKIISIGLKSKNNFSRLFASGFAFLIVSQGFVNIAMSLGLMPIIGIPLPFVSYGGSQLLSFYLGLGILQGIKTHSF